MRDTVSVMRWLSLLALLLVAGCPGSGGPQQVGTQPSWRGSGQAPVALAPITFAPSAEPAQRYNEPAPPPPRSEIGDAVTAAVKDAATKLGASAPAPDARLFRACEELAAITPEDGSPPYRVIEFAMHRNGIIEPSPRVLIMWGDIGSPRTIVQQLVPHLPEYLKEGPVARLGIGVAKRKADGTGAVVFALQASFVTTAPIPRVLPANGSFAIDAVVDPRYRDPEVFVTYDDGTTERIDVKTAAGGAFTSRVSCGKRIGLQQVEITASDVKGSTVLANFPVWCATQPPASLTVDPAGAEENVTTTEEAEQRLFALVNRDRVAAGLPALVWDDKIADVARGHSEDMRRTKQVAHISPTTGSAGDRVRAARIKTAVVLENVARAYGVGEAHQGLMNSPGHRANIMSRSATQLGIGVVFGDEALGRRELFVTQVFTRVPPKVNPKEVSATMEARIASSLPRKIGTSTKLAAIAQRLADELAAGKTREQAYPLVAKQVEALGNVYARVGSVITAAADLDSLDGKSLLGDGVVDDIGVGVAQGPHPEIGEGAMWIVVLFGQKR